MKVGPIGYEWRWSGGMKVDQPGHKRKPNGIQDMV